MRKKPFLRFSKWMNWKDRKNFSLKKYPDVYMLAITNKNLENKKVDFEDVVYIGMTNSQYGLNGRWDQLNNSINGKKYEGNSGGGHSGGNTIFNVLGSYKRWGKNLFVCAQALKCNASKNSESPRKPDDLRTMGWVAYLEYELIPRLCSAT